MTNTEPDDLESLAEKFAPLVFGIFGHADDENGSLVTRVGGSGVFVAPCYAITAGMWSAIFSTRIPRVQMICAGRRPATTTFHTGQVCSKSAKSGIPMRRLLSGE